MEVNAKIVEVLRDLTSCPLCNEAGIKMILLACGHTLCEDCGRDPSICIKKNKQTNTYLCPWCKSKQPCPVGGCAPNYFANNLQHELKDFETCANHALFPKSLQCHSCGNVSICLFCFEEAHVGHEVSKRVMSEKSAELIGPFECGSLLLTHKTKNDYRTWDSRYKLLLEICENGLNGNVNLDAIYSFEYLFKDGSSLDLGNWLIIQIKRKIDGTLDKTKEARLQTLVDQGYFQWSTERLFVLGNFRWSNRRGVNAVAGMQVSELTTTSPSAVVLRSDRRLRSVSLVSLIATSQSEQPVQEPRLELAAVTAASLGVVLVATEGPLLTASEEVPLAVDPRALSVFPDMEAPCVSEARYIETVTKLTASGEEDCVEPCASSSADFTSDIFVSNGTRILRVF